jgi:hypothetical protein
VPPAAPGNKKLNSASTERKITMPATIQRESDNIYVLRLSGNLEQSEFGKAQATIGSDIDAGMKPRVLAILEGFAGWERGAEWGNLDFLFWHSNEIAKIAIVGEARWEPEALAFAGAGLRNAPVKFFPPDQIAAARAWLAE